LFNFARHFGLLGLFTAVLAVAGPRAGPGIGAQFALYGALHAVALTLSAAGGARLSPGRRLLFVATAAMLALSAALLGLHGLHRLTGFGAPAGALIAACAGLGALAYGASIRGVLAAPLGAARRWSPKPIGATSLGCAAVAALSFVACRELHTASVLWLVAPWWFAFSVGLWYATAGESPRMSP
jgi:hypothetical protein